MKKIAIATSVALMLALNVAPVSAQTNSEGKRKELVPANPDPAPPPAGSRALTPGDATTTTPPAPPASNPAPNMNPPKGSANPSNPANPGGGGAGAGGAGGGAGN